MTSRQPNSKIPSLFYASKENLIPKPTNKHTCFHINEILRQNPDSSKAESRTPNYDVGL